MKHLHLPKFVALIACIIQIKYSFAASLATFVNVTLSFCFLVDHCVLGNIKEGWRPYFACSSDGSA